MPGKRDVLPPNDGQKLAEAVSRVARQQGAKDVLVVLVIQKRYFADLRGDPRTLAVGFGRMLASSVQGKLKQDIIDAFLEAAKGPPRPGTTNSSSGGEFVC